VACPLVSLVSLCAGWLARNSRRASSSTTTTTNNNKIVAKHEAGSVRRSDHLSVAIRSPTFSQRLIQWWLRTIHVLLPLSYNDHTTIKTLLSSSTCHWDMDNLYTFTKHPKHFRKVHSTELPPPARGERRIHPRHYKKNIQPSGLHWATPLGSMCQMFHSGPSTMAQGTILSCSKDVVQHAAHKTLALLTRRQQLHH
jgi:hypothetical protein